MTERDDGSGLDVRSMAYQAIIYSQEHVFVSDEYLRVRVELGLEIGRLLDPKTEPAISTAMRFGIMGASINLKALLASLDPETRRELSTSIVSHAALSRGIIRLATWDRASDPYGLEALEMARHDDGEVFLSGMKKEIANEFQEIESIHATNAFQRGQDLVIGYYRKLTSSQQPTG